MKKNSPIIGLAALIALSSVFPLAAQEGWNFTVGAGTFMSPSYMGSATYAGALMPIAKAEFATGSLSFSASFLDGLGITYFNMDQRLYANLAARFGEDRDENGYSAGFIPMDHDGETSRRLDGTGSVSGPAILEASVAWVSPVGLLGTIAAYHPLTVERFGNEDSKQGFIGSIFLLLPLPATERLNLTFVLQTDFMDTSYAEAWYSLPDSTGDLDAFKASWGIQDIQAYFQADWLFTEKFGLTFMMANQWLLGDAAKSPFTETTYQLNLGLYTFLKL